MLCLCLLLAPVLAHHLPLIQALNRFLTLQQGPLNPLQLHLQPLLVNPWAHLLHPQPFPQLVGLLGRLALALGPLQFKLAQRPKHRCFLLLVGSLELNCFNLVLIKL